MSSKPTIQKYFKHEGHDIHIFDIPVRRWEPQWVFEIDGREAGRMSTPERARQEAMKLIDLKAKYVANRAGMER